MMDRKKVSADQLLRILQIVAKLKLKMGAPPDIIEDFLGKIKEHAENNRFRPLWATVNDLPSYLFYISDRDSVRVLIGEIEKETGLSYFALFGDVEKKISAIIKRGRVKNEDEWRGLKSYLDQVDEADQDSDRINKIVEMLDKFEIEASLKSRT